MSTGRTGSETADEADKVVVGMDLYPKLYDEYPSLKAKFLVCLLMIPDSLA